MWTIGVSCLVWCGQLRSRPADRSLCSSPFNVNSASPERTAVDPYGVRLVPKTRRVTGFESRRYDEVLALPSFRPVHPAMMFDDEGF